ncbi:PLxRFG domain-containing protein [Ferrimonas balearica]|uniref:PLxRFG domain-containing protein n=1 Tax=Ferrimonas balearica TaxID=44012 RepID=UPI001F3CC81F|nr:PLxRFG domain-containing protein [Ferrimonas balearica]MBY6093866.1 PLxRFG domain-containing protein [Ferrimonas balearica]
MPYDPYLPNPDLPNESPQEQTPSALSPAAQRSRALYGARMPRASKRGSQDTDPAEYAFADVPEDKQQGFIADLVDAAQYGAIGNLGSTFELTDALFGVGGGLRDWATDWQDAQLEEMSLEGRQAMMGELFGEDEQGDLTFGEDADNWKAWAMQFGSLAGQAISMIGAGNAGISIGLRGAGRIAQHMAKKKLTEKAGTRLTKEKIDEIAARAGQQARTRFYRQHETGIQMGAFGVIGGGVAQGQAASEARSQGEQLTKEQLLQSDHFVELLGEQDLSLSQDERFAAAREQFLDDLSYAAASDPYLLATNALTGAIGGKYLDDMLTGARIAKTTAGRIGTGLAVEGSTEALQEGHSQYAVNRALNANDIAVDPWQGVKSSAATGAALGGGMGGAAGALNGKIEKWRNGTPDEDATLPDGISAPAENINLTARIHDEVGFKEWSLQVKENAGDVSTPFLQAALAEAKRKHKDGHGLLLPESFAAVLRQSHNEAKAKGVKTTADTAKRVVRNALFKVNEDNAQERPVEQPTPPVQNAPTPAAPVQQGNNTFGVMPPTEEEQQATSPSAQSTNRLLTPESDGLIRIRNPNSDAGKKIPKLWIDAVVREVQADIQDNIFDGDFVKAGMKQVERHHKKFGFPTPDEFREVMVTTHNQILESGGTLSAQAAQDAIDGIYEKRGAQVRDMFGGQPASEKPSAPTPAPNPAPVTDQQTTEPAPTATPLEAVKGLYSRLGGPKAERDAAIDESTSLFGIRKKKGGEKVADTVIRHQSVAQMYESLSTTDEGKLAEANSRDSLESMATFLNIKAPKRDKAGLAKAIIDWRDSVSGKIVKGGATQPVQAKPTPAASPKVAAPDTNKVDPVHQRELDHGEVKKAPPKAYANAPDKGIASIEKIGFLSGKDSKEIRETAAKRGDMGLLITPATSSYYNHAESYPFIGIDNGVFGSKGFEPAKFIALVNRISRNPSIAARTLFTVVPDVVGNHAETVKRFKEWHPQLKDKGLPLAFALQNGAEKSPDTIPWGDFDVLFIGGDNDFKLGNITDKADKAAWEQILNTAQENGVPIHMGRANTDKRMTGDGHYMGISTADGTTLAFAPDQNLAELTEFLDRYNQTGLNYDAREEIESGRAPSATEKYEAEQTDSTVLDVGSTFEFAEQGEYEVVKMVPHTIVGTDKQPVLGVIAKPLHGHGYRIISEAELEGLGLSSITAENLTPEQEAEMIEADGVGDIQIYRQQLMKPILPFVSFDTKATRPAPISQQEADDRLLQWQDAARRSNKPGNSEKIILSLFDSSGAWSKPWRDAGFNVVQVDQNMVAGAGVEMDVTDIISTEWLNQEAGQGELYGILAACPCTDFSYAGQRFKKEKEASGQIDESRKLAKHTMDLIEHFAPEFWIVENPLSDIGDVIKQKPKLLTTPANFGDSYTKKTQFFGWFNSDFPTAQLEITDTKKASVMQQKLFGTVPAHVWLRSLTPDGLAYATFMANGYNPEIALRSPEMIRAEGYEVERSDIEELLEQLKEVGPYRLVPFAGVPAYKREKTAQKYADQYSKARNEPFMVVTDGEVFKAVPAEDYRLDDGWYEVGTAPQPKVEVDPVDAALTQLERATRNGSWAPSQNAEAVQTVVDWVQENAQDAGQRESLIEGLYDDDLDHTDSFAKTVSEVRELFKEAQTEASRQTLKKWAKDEQGKSLVDDGNMAQMVERLQDLFPTNPGNYTLAEVKYASVSLTDPSLVSSSSPTTPKTKTEEEKPQEEKETELTTANNPDEFPIEDVRKLIANPDNKAAMKRLKTWVKERIGMDPHAEATLRILESDSAESVMNFLKGLNDVYEQSINPNRPLFSKSNTLKKAPATGMTIKAVEFTVDRWLKRYKGAGNVKVEVVERQSMIGAPPEVIARGFYQNGTVYLVAENLKNKADVESALRHEVLVHHGLRAVITQADFNEIISAIIRNSDDKQLKPFWDLVDEHYPEETVRRKAEEVLAHYAEALGNRNIVVRAWDKVVRLIKAALTRAGLLQRGDISASDLRDVLDSIGEGFRKQRAIESVLSDQMASQEQAPLWFSPTMTRLKEIAEETKEGTKIDANQLLARIRKDNKIPAEEMEWMGIDALLEMKAEAREKVDVRQLIEDLSASEAKVEEVWQGPEYEYSTFQNDDKYERGFIEDVEPLKILANKLVELIPEEYGDYPLNIEGATPSLGIFTLESKKESPDYFVIVLDNGNENGDQAVFYVEKGVSTFIGMESGTQRHIAREHALLLRGKHDIGKKKLVNKAKWKNMVSPGGHNDSIENLIVTFPGARFGTYYNGTHWGEIKNPLLHVRYTTRGDTIVIEEIQSDIHQNAGGKRGTGYAGTHSLKQKAKFAQEVKERRTEIHNLQSLLDEAVMSGENYFSEKLKDFRAKIDEQKQEAEDLINQATHFDKASKEGMPDMPWKDSKAWATLAIRRMLVEAVRRGANKIQIVNGIQSAVIGGKAAMVDSFKIDYRGEHNWGLSEVSFYKDGSYAGGRISFKTLDELQKALKSQLNERAAARIMEVAEFMLGRGVVEERGGEFTDSVLLQSPGHNYFYNTLIPSVLKKEAKRWGFKIGKASLPNEDGTGKATPTSQDKDDTFYPDYDWEATEITITDKTREVVQKGMPLFSKRKKAVSDLTPTEEAKYLFGKMGEAVKATAKAAKDNPKQALKELSSYIVNTVKEGRRPALGLLPWKSIEEMATRNSTKGAPIFGSVKKFTDVIRSFDGYRNEQQYLADKLADVWRTLAVRNPKQEQAMRKLMHDTTLLQLDPTAEKIRRFVDLEALNGEIAALQREIKSKGGKSAKWKELQQKVEERDFELMRIRRFPEIKRRYAQLHKPYQKLYADVKNAYSDRIKEHLKVQEEHLMDVYNARGATLQDDIAALQAKADKSVREGNNPEGVQKWFEQERDKLKTEFVRSNRAARKTIEKIRVQFKGLVQKGPYFPLSRFGNYFVAIRPKGSVNADGEREILKPIYFATRDSAHEWKKLREQLKKDPRFPEDKFDHDAGVKEENFDPSIHLGGQLISEVNTLVDDALLDENPELAKKLKDNFIDIYYRMLPEVSTRKHQIGRRGVAGYDEDALRGFGQYMFHDSYQLARLKYGEKMRQQVTRVEDESKTYAAFNGKEVKGMPPELATWISEATKERLKYIMAPKGGALASYINSFGFAYYLGVTPAAAVINLAQVPAVTLPHLAAKYGSKKSFDHLSKAYKDVFGSGGTVADSNKLTPEERRAYKEWLGQGTLTRTMIMDLAGIADSGVHYNAAVHRALGAAAKFFHGAEQINREVTALAAFRLERAKGTSFDEAVKAASHAVDFTHFDYTSNNKPALLQNSVAKVALLFRQYGINMMWRMLSDAHQSFKGLDPEARKEAQIRFGGMMGMAFLFTGSMGLPFYTIYKWMFGLFQMMFGDDDEPITADLAMRNTLTEIFGADFGAVIAHGPVQHFSGAGVANRMSLANLFFMTDDRERTNEEMVPYVLELLGGPAVGIAKSVGRGVDNIAEGHVDRGIEAMLPKFARDALKGYRYYNEGVLNKREQPIIEELNALQLFYQVFGFVPTELAETYERNGQLMGLKQRLNNRRYGLMDLRAMAIRTNDRMMFLEAERAIAEWNRKHPENPILKKHLIQSMKSRARYDAITRQGIAIEEKWQHLWEENNFLDDK